MLFAAAQRLAQSYPQADVAGPDLTEPLRPSLAFELVKL